MLQLRNARLPSEQRTQHRGRDAGRALHTKSSYSYTYTGPVPLVAYVVRTRAGEVVGLAEVGGEGSLVSQWHGVMLDLCARPAKIRYAPLVEGTDSRKGQVAPPVSPRV